MKNLDVKTREPDLETPSTDLILGGGDPPDPSPKLKIPLERERALIPVAWNMEQVKPIRILGGASRSHRTPESTRASPNRCSGSNAPSPILTS
jgi:hypothetical protein